LIIIEAGPGGMTAALYVARANLNVLILDKGIYDEQMMNTSEIENYPGVSLIEGYSYWGDCM
jgi:Thioredoxin reductase